MEERGSKFSSELRRRSRTLTAGKRRCGAITIVPKSAGLVDFGIWIMIVRFQLAGMLQWLNEKL